MAGGGEIDFFESRSNETPPIYQKVSKNCRFLTRDSVANHMSYKVHAVLHRVVFLCNNRAS